MPKRIDRIAIIRDLKRGMSRVEVSARHSVSYGKVSTIASEIGNIKKLSGGGFRQFDHAEAICDVRRLGGISAAARLHGVTREAVRRVVKNYEQQTGERLPRHETKLPPHVFVDRIEIECPNCHETFSVLPSRQRTYCSAVCAQRHIHNKGITDPKLDDAVRRIVKGETNFNRLSIEYNYTQSNGFIRIIYSYLIRNNRRDDIKKLWPAGVPMWLRKYGMLVQPRRTRNELHSN